MADTLVRDASMRRVLVVGCPGAGKSTFARRLGTELGLPVIHLDFHYWLTGWQLPDAAAWREQVAALVTPPEWVMDGNYANTFDIRMPRADSMVWLDYPRAVCMRRAIKRMINGYGRTRPDLPPGWPEKFDLEFLRFVWDFPRTQRSRIPAGVDQFGGHLRVTRFGCDLDAENFLAALGAH
jgi:adenylate kinase family enzyme